jgi:hypothetical protein
VLMVEFMQQGTALESEQNKRRGLISDVVLLRVNVCLHTATHT